MKALRRISSKMKSAAITIGQTGMRLAADRLRTLLGAGALALSPILAVAATEATEPAGQTPATNIAMPETPIGFTGIGPVVSGSVSYDEMPSKARKFLERHCDGHAVVKLEKEFESGDFDVRLADGIDIEFNSKGNIVEIEAPEGYCLAPTLLKAVVPGKLYQLLDHNGFSESVSAVKHDRMGYRLDIADPVFDQVCYDPSGVLTMIVDN